MWASGAPGLGTQNAEGSPRWVTAGPGGQGPSHHPVRGRTAGGTVKAPVLGIRHLPGGDTEDRCNSR